METIGGNIVRTTEDSIRVCPICACIICLQCWSSKTRTQHWGCGCRDQTHDAGSAKFTRMYLRGLVDHKNY